MMLKTLSLLCTLGFAILGTSIEAKVETKGKAPAAPAMDPSFILGMICPLIKTLSPSCEKACENISDPSIPDLTCCIYSEQSKLSSVSSAISTFCSTACGPLPVIGTNPCACAASPCSTSAKYLTNICGAVCCNNPAWMNDNVTQCLAAYLPDAHISCASSFFSTANCPQQTK